MTWDGQERRSDNRDFDHDLLVEVHTLLKGMKENYAKHVEDDEKHFGRLYKATGSLKWYVALGTGAITALEFFKDRIFGK